MATPRHHSTPAIADDPPPPGARRHPATAPLGAPPPDVVHRLHDRFLFDVVEQLGLCPFARRSREQGRVHRPLFYGAPTPLQVAEAVHRLVTEHDDAEIVLVTFVAAGSTLDWVLPRAFDDFVKDVRPLYDALEGPTFFMVGFHPRSGEPEQGDTPPKLTADSLVPLLRRTPDPVIQCVRAQVLQRVRAQAQEVSHAKMMAEAKGLDPRLRAILERSVQPDSSLSADIARHNYDAVARGDGRERLEQRIAELHRDRQQTYAPWWKQA